ncbi:MAG: hypothetical protein JRM85_05965 [Nitrososphaerota archaeon]|nr:hypothetical protein [Nitrososphaerota archaeon]MDG6917974.1 hypothetical protein [Nitrososphaerota archaeon]
MPATGAGTRRPTWFRRGGRLKGATVGVTPMGWYYHTCPKCREKSRKRVVRTERKSAEKVELSRGTWMTRGGVQVKEPFHVWVYAYEVEHECRSCKHRWIECVTKQRPW